MSVGGRIERMKIPGLELSDSPRPADVTFYFDGEPVQGRLGEPVAISLWALGHRILGWNEESGRPRGLYCSIGQCFECRVTVDGRRDLRACLTPVQEGLQVIRQPKPGPLETVDGLERP